MIDWAGWAVFGLVATVGLTAVMSVAQLTGRTRLDLPLVLGTLFAADPDRARVAGFVTHLGMGQVFALFYSAGFSALGRAGWWLGALFGLVHGLVALAVVIPVVATMHPRMATPRAGLGDTALLQPPGPLAVHYGAQTPLVAVLAHLAYGAMLGLVLEPR